MKTIFFWLLIFLMIFLVFGGVYWGTAVLDNPQKALDISIKIGILTKSSHFIPIVIGSALLIILSILIPIFFRSYNQNQLRNRLLIDGVQTTAEIISVKDTRIRINKDPRVKITVNILHQEASFEITVSRISIPRVGDWMAVRYDPNDPSQAVPAAD